MFNEKKVAGRGPAKKVAGQKEQDEGKV
jgi:hypothetical protein